MPKIVDRTGHRYGRLLVLERAENRLTSGGNPIVMWRCECDCGGMVNVASGSLAQGRTQSCGCLEQESRRLSHLTHGASRTKLYNIWSAIKQRCLNPDCKGYRNYGGRGITLAPEWHTFDAFARDMGPRPSDRHSVERIDNSKGYGPSNCRWATRAEQARNTRRNVLIDYQGQQFVASDLAQMAGISLRMLRKRMMAGWPEDKWLMPSTRKARQ